MNEHRYGRQILAEAHSLSSVMKARKPKYGSRELPYLIKQYMPSLAQTPQFERQLLSLIVQTPDWGRNQFLDRVFELIGKHFGVAVPDRLRIAPRVSRLDALADAVEDRKQQIEADNEDFRLGMMADEQRPWDD